MAVSFDVFGTLVAVDRLDEPGAAVARELAARGVTVPDGFAAAYREPQTALAPGRERPLSAHVRDALVSCGVRVTDPETVEAAVFAAFTSDATVRTRPGANAALSAAAERGPVGVCSNCRVRGLVDWTLHRGALDRSLLDAVVVSVDCGYRKPDRRPFLAVADALGVEAAALVHVGDDPATDGGVTDVGGEFVPADDLAALADRLEGPA